MGLFYWNLRVSSDSQQSKRKLGLVEPRHELSGKFPRRFEQAARAASVGDRTHRGLLFVTLTLVRHGLARCLPPSFAPEWSAQVAAIEAWAHDRGTLGSVRKARQTAFEASGRMEGKTLELFEQWLDAPRDTFDEHANRVVLRYVGLGIHHGVGALLQACDGVLDPAALLQIPKQVASAVAYQNIALGPARSSELRAEARVNATWEAERIIAVQNHDARALAVQLFHEYLGVHWKNHVDAQRLYLEELLEWGLGAEA